MGLIGPGLVTIVAIGAGVRSTRLMNKLLVVGFWAGYVAVESGWSL